MKRYLRFLFLFLFLLFPLQGSADMWSSDSILATVGYGNYINPGRYTPITITIKEGHALSGGTVTLNVPTNENDRYLYQKPYPSSSGTVYVTFSVPLSNSYDPISVTIDNQLGASQQMKLNYSFPKANEDSPIFFGLLSNSDANLNYFNQLNLTEYSLTGYCYSLSKSEILSDFRCMDSFDCIIIDEYSLSSLHESQIETLKQWVYSGGIVLLGNNTDHLDKLLSSSLSDISYHTVSELDSESEHAILTKYSYGNGCFFTASFSFASIATTFINNQILQDDLMNIIFTSKQLHSLEQPVFSSSTSMHNEVSALTSQVQATTDVNLLLYGLILLCYLFLFIPLIYYILKNHDFMQHFCLILPAVSIAVAGIIFALGSKTRFSHPFLTYVRIQEYEDTTLTESVFTGIQAPYNRAYSVSLDNSYELIPLQTTSLSSSSDGVLSSAKHQVQIDYRTNDYLLTFENFVAFHMRNFQLQKTSELTDHRFVPGNVLYYNNSVSGVLSNQLGVDLTNAILVLPGYFVRIGDFSKNASVILENCNMQMNNSAKYQPSDPTILSEITQTPNHPLVSSNDTKEYLLYYYLKQCDLASKDIGYLIGFTDTDSNFQIATDYRANGLTLVSCPVTITMSKLKQTYYPALPAQVHQISGDFSENGEEIYSHFATVRYDIFQDFSINELDLFLQESFGSSSYTSKIYFWRNDECKYEQVYPGKTHFTSEDLKTYITSENSLLVQYYTEDTYARLPRITATGGRSNVNH